MKVISILIFIFIYIPIVFAQSLYMTAGNCLVIEVSDSTSLPLPIDSYMLSSKNAFGGQLNISYLLADAVYSSPTLVELPNDSFDTKVVIPREVHCFNLKVPSHHVIDQYYKNYSWIKNNLTFGNTTIIQFDVIHSFDTLLIDEISFEEPQIEEGLYRNINLGNEGRELFPHNWSPICLPFALDKSDLEDIKVASFDHVVYDCNLIDSIELHFKLEDSMDANVPYLLYNCTDEIIKLGVNNRVVYDFCPIDICKDNIVFHGTNRMELFDMYNGEDFINSQYMKAMRAYFYDLRNGNVCHNYSIIIDGFEEEEQEFESVEIIGYNKKLGKRYDVSGLLKSSTMNSDFSIENGVIIYYMRK